MRRKEKSKAGRKKSPIIKYLIGGMSLSMIAFAILIFFVLIMFIGIIMGNSSVTENGENGAEQSAGGYSEAVESYRDLITQLCEEYNTQPEKLNLPDYVNACLAMIEIESGGAGTDPMQASECGYNTQYPKTPNGIQDPEYSCRCGVQYLRDSFITFGVSSPEDYDKMASSAQGYNFGITGWHKFIKEKNEGKYTVELAQEYSDNYMPANAKGTPTHGQKFINAYTKGIKRTVTDDGFIFYFQGTNYNGVAEPWANHHYKYAGGGFNTMANSGCAPTSLAMIVANLCDNTVTPDQVADLAYPYHVNGGTDTGGMVKGLASTYGYRYQIYDCRAKGLSNKVDECLKTGGLVLWSAGSPSPFTTAGHCMVIRGVTDDGKWLIADPNGAHNPNHPLAVQYGITEKYNYYPFEKSMITRYWHCDVSLIWKD